MREVRRKLVRLAAVLVITGLVCIVMLLLALYASSVNTALAAADAIPTPTLSLEKGFPEACPGLEELGVPRAVIDEALRYPGEVQGWNRKSNPNAPESQFNRRKRWLDIRSRNLSWHPTFNGVEYKLGCSRAP